MEKEGYASLWLGKLDSEEQLDKLLEIDYTDEGDSVPSAFARYFGIEWYDDDFREAEFFAEEGRGSDAANLLAGFSYEDELIPKFADLLKGGTFDEFNTVIILYNFAYNGEQGSYQDTSAQLKFIGSVPYQA
ncbi:Immunity protein 22 [Paenibacillus algorifonticola]|uniref:Immunity protein 22 n=1 Tax=Paenibacillus algorifonticola TaxID=684063 RepID=A0A1I2E2E7_9BACL|nr:immunity 22 family protein [Paenibacillus algorifonticola]SFE86846.1 Immunity protein 22 [Paenibacillus algorifonticola]